MHFSHLLPLTISLFLSATLAAPTPSINNSHPLLTQAHLQGHGKTIDVDGHRYAKNFLQDDAVEKFKPLDAYRQSLAIKKDENKHKDDSDYDIYPTFGEKKKARHGSDPTRKRAGPRIEQQKYLTKRGLGNGKELLGKSYALMRDGEAAQKKVSSPPAPKKEVNKTVNKDTKESRVDEKAEQDRRKSKQSQADEKVEEDGRKVLDEKWKMIAAREKKANDYERAHQTKIGDSDEPLDGRKSGESESHSRVTGEQAANAGNANDPEGLKRNVFTSWRGEKGKQLLQDKGKQV